MIPSAWTTREIRVLREVYPRTSMTGVLAALPRHTIKGIRRKAHQLGIRRARIQRDWVAIVAAHRFTFDLGVRTA